MYILYAQCVNKNAHVYPCVYTHTHKHLWVIYFNIKKIETNKAMCTQSFRDLCMENTDLSGQSGQEILGSWALRLKEPFKEQGTPETICWLSL